MRWTRCAVPAICTLFACTSADMPVIEVTLSAQTQQERSADFPLVIAAWNEEGGQVAGLQTLCEPTDTDLQVRFHAPPLEVPCGGAPRGHAAIASWTFAEGCVDLKSDAVEQPRSSEVPDLEVVDEWLKSVGGDWEEGSCLAKIAL